MNFCNDDQQHGTHELSVRSHAKRWSRQLQIRVIPRIDGDTKDRSLRAARADASVVESARSDWSGSFQAYMCVDMCVDMSVDMCVDMSVDRCADMCVNMCV